MNIFNPNTDKLENYYDKGRYILAWRLSILFVFAFFILSISSLKSSISEFLIYLICEIITITALVYLYKTKKFRFVYFYFSILGTGIAFYTANFFYDMIHIGDFLWIILIIMLSYFGLGKKYGALFLVINLVTVAFYSLFSVNNNISELSEIDFMGRVALMVELLVATFSISYVVYQFTIFHTYSYKGLSQANSELENQHQVIDSKNNENTILIKEIHHRVKNNLQIVISLLRLHKNELNTEESKHHFQEAINRIMVMSLIHKKLYQDNLLAEIEIKDYLEDLTNDISKLSTLSIPIEVNVSSNIERVGLKTIVPLGLIINELMSNSIEHAFHNRSEAKIQITIKSLEDNKFELMYYDNGFWSDQNEEYVSFGLELIEILTSQLEGTMKKANSQEGTSYTFNLKDLDIEN